MRILSALSLMTAVLCATPSLAANFEFNMFKSNSISWNRSDTRFFGVYNVPIFTVSSGDTLTVNINFDSNEYFLGTGNFDFYSNIGFNNFAFQNVLGFNSSQVSLRKSNGDWIVQPSPGGCNCLSAFSQFPLDFLDITAVRAVIGVGLFEPVQPGQIFAGFELFPIVPPPPPLPQAVPEPASWIMLIVGFGLVGTALRSRKIVVA